MQRPALARPAARVNDIYVTRRQPASAYARRACAVLDEATSPEAAVVRFWGAGAAIARTLDAVKLVLDHYGPYLAHITEVTTRSLRTGDDDQGCADPVNDAKLLDAALGGDEEALLHACHKAAGSLPETRRESRWISGISISVALNGQRAPRYSR